MICEYFFVEHFSFVAVTNLLLGFDTHADIERLLGYLFKEINGAFDSFSQEMKALNLWDNVTVIQTSDFARTLNPNGSHGTDHAWGGNYMLMGRLS